MQKILAFLALLLCGNLSFSQIVSPENTTVSAGDFFKQINGSLSWTLGETITETVNSNNSKLTQGFQQSNFNLVAIPLVKTKEFEITAYPNPTSDKLTIYINQPNSKQEFFAELFDLQGNLILTETINSLLGSYSINLKGLSNGFYLLKIYSDNHQFSNFMKVQKIQ